MLVRRLTVLLFSLVAVGSTVCFKGYPAANPCPVCDGRVYKYGIWRLQYDAKGDDLYIVYQGSAGVLAFRLWADSNGWFDFIERGFQGTAWSTGNTTANPFPITFPIDKIMAAQPAGDVRESLFTIGNWDFVFGSGTVTIRNAEDVGREAYVGIIVKKGTPSATFQGVRVRRTFVAGCPAVLTEIYQDAVEAVLTSLGLAYKREDFFEDRPAWSFKLDGNKVVLYPFNLGPTEGFAGLQLVYFNCDIDANISQVNQWNNERRGSRAYIDEDGCAVLEAELYLDGGITEDVVATFIHRFGRNVKDFVEFLQEK